ncbi:hypothetical protein [Deinococcus peraridilitoris]|uniref:hypothetical protein n=1 Tax=Deinococcus peraridilitoris TaxID=432329 RepID=UPI00059BE1CB
MKGEQKRETQQVLRVRPLRGHHVRQGGLAFREGSRLVEDHGVHAGGGFQRGRIFEQHAFARGLAHADRDGRRGRQRQGVRAGDHDVAHRGDQRERGRREFQLSHRADA